MPISKDGQILLASVLLNILQECLLTFILIIILIINIQLMDIQAKKTASDYAKAKVQQIRRKFGYPNNKQNAQQAPKDSKPTNSPSTTSKISNKDQPLSIISTNERHPVTETKAQQYENRIKNIDMINKKIADMLKEKDYQLKSYAARNNSRTRRDPTTERIRRQSVGVQRTGLKEVEPKHLNVQQNKTNFIARPQSYNYTQRQKTRLELSKPIPVQARQNLRQNPPLQISNTKYTVSIELKSSPRKIQKQPIPISRKLQLEQIKPCKQQPITPPPVEIKKVIPQAPKVQSIKKFQIEEDGYKKQTLKLAEALSQQIEKDQKLRYSKWQFGEWNNPNKWQLLQQKFTPKQTPEQIQKLFTLSSQQHNPFFQIESPVTQSCIQDLIENYNEANKFWKDSVRENSSIDKLEKQYFSVRDIDLNKKGYLSIQDVVCFVNLYTGKFFRNRDAIGLMKRFVKEGGVITDGVKYERFLDIVTK